MSTITVWVLFVWMGGAIPASWTYETLGECKAAAETYKRAQCIVMVLPRR